MTEPPTLHHIAMGAADVERVSAFWRDLIGLPERMRHHRDDGTVRSIWLGLGSESVLMIESLDVERQPLEGPVIGQGPFLIALAVQEDEYAGMVRRLREAGCRVEASTPHTTYVRDPEDNRAAVSHYPLGRRGHDGSRD
ncbi:MAG: VOC family protein [Myxococcota bacterium]